MSKTVSSSQFPHYSAIGFTSICFYYEIIDYKNQFKGCMEKEPISDG